MKRLKEKMYKWFANHNKPDKLRKIFTDLQADFERLYDPGSSAWEGVGMLFLHSRCISSVKDNDGTTTNDYIGGHSMFGNGDAIASAIANLLRENASLREEVLKDLHKNVLLSPLDSVSSQDSDSQLHFTDLMD